MFLIKIAEDFVKKLFKENLNPDITYHNYDHTKNVYQSSEILVSKENFSEIEVENILLASLFHDTGYTESIENHEENSVKIAATFLASNGVAQERIDAISKIILATKKYAVPQNLSEKIIRDADCAHVGCGDFFETTENLRNELKKTMHLKLSKQNWAEINVDFLNKQNFHTDFAKENWEQQKQKNIEKLKAKIGEMKGEKGYKDSIQKEKSLLNKKKLEKLESPERGIETMFRVTLNNHTKLSQIADSKANILLSVNAIIISVALSTIIPKLDAPRNSHLIIPTFLLIMFSVVCIIFAIASTRPKISSGTFTRKEIEERKINLLFFGNFHKMPLEEYTWAMQELMKKRDYLYDSMIKDLYYLGIVLNRKYKLLRTTYTIFTIGIIVSVIAFVIAFQYNMN